MEKEKPKRGGTEFVWAVLSHFIGVRSQRERATAKRAAKEQLGGSAALIRQQPMGGEREAQEERDGIRLGGSFASHWRALSARARYLIRSHLIGCALIKGGAFRTLSTEINLTER